MHSSLRSESKMVCLLFNVLNYLYFQYRVPPLKSRRTVTKEKYSPKVKTFTRDVSCVPIKVIQPLKTIKKRSLANRNIVCKYI